MVCMIERATESNLLSAAMARSGLSVPRSGCCPEIRFRSSERLAFETVPWAVHTSPRMRNVEREPFSEQLERWLKDDAPKTIGRLGQVFGEKSFAVAVLLLMFVPAIPAPTGGITHVFEVITVIIGAEMVIGARTIWLPARWRDRELGATITTKGIPFIARTIRWFERFSRPRAASLYEQQWWVRVLGVIVVALAVGAAFAPPFSGLDTLPALGAVIVALSIILSDVLLLGIGLVIGTGGIILIITIGAAVVRLIKEAL